MPKGSIRLITKCGETSPASLPACRCQRSSGARGVSVLLSLLFLTHSFLPVLHLLLSRAHCRGAAGVSGAWCQASPVWVSAQAPWSWHCRQPPPSLETECCLGGPAWTFTSRSVCAQPKASVFCGRTLVSFTPIISFSLVAACSTYKVQLVSDRLPGFEDCITEHRSCLNGVQGKKEK